MTIELDTTLAQAEVLFLSFAQLVADIDRRQADAAASSSSINGVRRRKTGDSAASTTATAKLENTNINLPTLSDNLRELLVSGRS